MAKQWTTEEINRLIEKYESVEILWKTTDKAFRDRNKKNVILTKFAEQFSCSEGEIKRKLHNLRNQMSQELKKNKKRKSGAGTDEVYSSKWPYFRALQFLIPFLTTSPTKSNLVDKHKSILPSFPFISEKDCEEQIDDPTTIITVNNSSESLQDAEVIEKTISKGRPIKRRHASNDEDCLKAALKILKKEPDEYDGFGQYVAQELRSLRFDFNKRKLKSEIRKAIVLIADEDDSLSQAPTSSQTNNNSLLTVPRDRLNFSTEGPSTVPQLEGSYERNIEFDNF